MLPVWLRPPLSLCLSLGFSIRHKSWVRTVEITYVLLDGCSFQIFGLPRVLLTQERTEADEVVLDQDVLLSQLFLADTASFLLPKRDHSVVSNCVGYKAERQGSDS